MYFVDLKKYLLLCMYGHLKIGLCISSGTLSFCLKWNWEVELSWSGLYSKCFYLEPSHWPDFMDFFFYYLLWSMSLYQHSGDRGVQISMNLRLVCST